MADKKSLLETDQGAGSGRVPRVDVSTTGSGGGITGSAGTAKPSGSRVPEAQSTSGKLARGSGTSAFSSENPQRRRR